MRQEDCLTPLLCVAGALWCGLLAVGILFAAVTGCWGDTSGCANSRAKNGTYAGVLKDRGGRALRDTTFSVAFGSREDEPVGDFRTDARGRFCIVWASERNSPYARVGGAEADLDANWRPLRGADPPPGCQQTSAGVPWLSAPDATSSPWFVIHLLLPLAGGAGLLFSLVGGLAGGVALRIGTALAITSTVLVFTL